MKSIDFRYDGRLLSDFGLMVCDFNGGNGIDTVSNGSEIKFNTVPIMHGKKHLLTSSEYEDCLQSEFDICVKLCDTDDMVISVEKQRELMRWLNRRTFHKFEITDDIEYNNIYFMGSFNVEKVEFNKDVIGFHLTLITDKPFGYQEDIKKIFKVNDTTKIYPMIDESDEIGYLYLDATIKCLQAGNLIITNQFNGDVTQIKNCAKNEVITLKHPIISFSNSHTPNDFNYNFIRIGNTYNKNRNEYLFSLPCNVEFTYSPIAKVSI